MIFSCTFMPMTGMFSKMSSDGDSIGGRLALVAWCVYFLPVGILSFLHFRKKIRYLLLKRPGRKTQIMIKIYGMPTCPYCDYVHQQIIGREDEFKYINIGENIRNMSAFTRLRDTSPVFDRCKEIGDVGIPAFVFEDGRISIDPADAGLIDYGSPDACSIEDHKSGRKGC